MLNLLAQIHVPVNSLTWVGIAGGALVAAAGILALFGFVAAFVDKPVLAARGLWGTSLCLFAAFVSLGVLFVTSQFQFRYVQRHSAYDHELQYKIAGVWSGQEGSFLLWAVGSALFCSLAVSKAGKYKRWFSGVCCLFLGALAGILMFESPFRLNPAGTDLRDGFGLPASLLNYWVVIHPPTIFMGFGCLTALFAWSVAAMLHRDLDTWIDQVRPWALIGLSFCGVGLCMGGFWAYETLGWGGFWAWDPVENTSLVPWIFLAVFVHGVIVQKARAKWHWQNVFYAAAPFVSFVYGTFLTRSGFLGDTSVHNFAQMDRTAMWILVGIGAAALVGFGGVFAWARKQIDVPSPQPNPGFWTRETFYAYGNWFMMSVGLVAGFGMSVPLIQSLQGRQPKVVEEHLYNTMVSIPFMVVMVLMAIAPLLSWRAEGLANFKKYFVNLLAATIATVGFLLLWVKWGGNEVQFGPWILQFPGMAADPGKQVQMLLSGSVPATPWILFLIGLCAFSVYATLVKAYLQFRKKPLSSAGMLTHIGFALTMAGLIFSRGFEQKVTGISVHESKTVSAFGYKMSLMGASSTFDNRHNKIEIRLDNGQDVHVARPGLYFTMGRNGMPNENVWPDIISRPLYDIYVVVRSFQFNEDGTPDFGGSEPQPLLPGQTGVFFGTMATYHGMETEGTPGMAGAKFTAVITIETAEGTKTVRPYVKLVGPGQLERPVVDLGHGLGLMLDSINAADKSANISFKYLTPAYPVEVYYKPLTILVWWGVGIMAVGGGLTAYYRRNQRTEKGRQDETPAAPEPQTDATQEPVEV